MFTSRVSSPCALRRDKPSGEGMLGLEGTGCSRRGAFWHRKAQRPFLSVGKGGLESGHGVASRCATKPIRRAWNGHPGLRGSANAPDQTMGNRISTN